MNTKMGSTFWDPSLTLAFDTPTLNRDRYIKSTMDDECETAVELLVSIVNFSLRHTEGVILKSSKLLLVRNVKLNAVLPGE